MSNENVTVNRKYKDTVFRKLFSDKSTCMELYNALNITDYTDDSEFEIVTLENAVYMSRKNDLAFVLDYRLSLYEHQSTHNPNIPLRDLFYISSEYQKMITNKSVYASTPVFVERINMYRNEGCSLDEAVVQAVDECIEEGILKDFLLANKAEVIAVSIFEFDEEKEWRLFGEAEREAGRREERKELMVSLVKDGILTLQEAAKRFDFPEEELKKYI